MGAPNLMEIRTAGLTTGPLAFVPIPKMVIIAGDMLIARSCAGITLWK